MKHNGRKFVKTLALIMAFAAAIPAMPAAAEGAVDLHPNVSVSSTQGVDAEFSGGAYDLSALLSAAAVPAVTNQSTKIYQKPGSSSRSVTVPKGFQLNILYSNDTYAIVEKNGVYGFALRAHLTSSTSSQEDAVSDAMTSGTVVETYKATVVVDVLPIYRSANASKKPVGALTAGSGVTVYAHNGQWAFVGRSGKFGFCAIAGLERGQGQVDSDTPAGNVAVTVMVDSMNVYDGPSTSSKLLGALPKGTTVNLVRTDGSWAYIELNGRYGYSAVSALTSQTSQDGGTQGEIIQGYTPLGTATVIEPSAQVYSSMNTASAASTLNLGETVSYYGYDSTWMLVGREDSFGFMLISSLSIEDYAELTLEDSGAGVIQLEMALLTLGYLDTVPSVNYTSATSTAVQRLQAALNMNQTGTADVPTLRVLHSGNAPASPILSATLSSGDVNDNVTRLQTRLYALGYLSRESSIDGDYGTTTANAVRLFQTAAGISATGTADNATIRALYKLNAPAIGSTQSPADLATSSDSSSGGSSGNTTSIPEGLASTTSTYSPSMSNAQKLEHVIYVAQQQLGKPYVFGAAGPAKFDCSGLMMYCFGKIGITLQHSAQGEGYNDNHAKISSKTSLVRGDMVFFNTVKDADMCDHVGIYLGRDYFLHAGSGAGKVIISTLSTGYYSRVYSWGRRVLKT